MKVLESDNCCQINHDAAKRKGHDMVNTKTIFRCFGSYLLVDEDNEKWLTKEEQSLLKDIEDL